MAAFSALWLSCHTIQRLPLFMHARKRLLVTGQKSSWLRKHTVAYSYDKWLSRTNRPDLATTQL